MGILKIMMEVNVNYQFLLVKNIKFAQKYEKIKSTIKYLIGLKNNNAIDHVDKYLKVKVYSDV